MKKYFLTGLSILAILLLLSKPVVFTDSVVSGMKLCFYHVIPALFPMILLSNYMIRENLCQTLSKLLHPLIHQLFGVTEYGSFAILTGFLCGFPVASKNISHLYHRGCLSTEEAAFLTSFCNNCSFSFVINYLGCFCLENILDSFQIICFIYLPAILCGILNHFFYHFSPEIHREIPEKVNVINDTFHALVRISFIVILFTMITRWVETLPLPLVSKICPLLEITSGLSFLSSFPMTKATVWSLLLCTVFGGASSMAQCFSFLNEPIFKKCYILGKLEQTAILLLLLILFY